MPTTVEKFFEEKRKGREHYRTDARGRAESYEKRVGRGEGATKNFRPLEASSHAFPSLFGNCEVLER